VENPFAGMDPDTMLRTLKQEADQMEAKARRLQEDLAAATTTVTSPDGAVTVTLSPTGALQDISFSDKATNHRPSTLGPLVMKTVQTAQRQVADKVSEALSQQLGSERTTDFMRQFVPQPPPEQPRRVEQTSDDDPGSVLRKRPGRGQQPTETGRPRRRPDEGNSGSLLR
jgi:DNA-binding protein YbaB